MTKKTAYNVDLTVEEVMSGAAASPPKKDSKEPSKQSSPTSEAPPTQALEKSGRPKSNGAAVAGKDKKKKDKKKQESTSSDSSSSSSSDSDSDTGKNKGMKRALEAWRCACVCMLAWGVRPCTGMHAQAAGHINTMQGTKQHHFFNFAGHRYPFYSPSASYRQLDVISGSHQYTISG